MLTKEYYEDVALVAENTNWLQTLNYSFSSPVHSLCPGTKLAVSWQMETTMRQENCKYKESRKTTFQYQT